MQLFDLFGYYQPSPAASPKTFNLARTSNELCAWIQDILCCKGLHDHTQSLAGFTRAGQLKKHIRHDHVSVNTIFVISVTTVTCMLSFCLAFYSLITPVLKGESNECYANLTDRTSACMTSKQSSFMSSLRTPLGFQEFVDFTTS